MNKDEALNRFYMMMGFRNLSPNTIHQYEWFISKFLEHYDNKEITSLTVEDAQDYVISLFDSYSPASLNSVICAIRYFYAVVLNNELDRWKFPNIIFDKPEVHIYSEDQIKLMLEHADIRLKAMIMLGIDAGLRVGEVARLKVSDIDSNNHLIHIHHSKRRKSRNVPLSQKTLEVLRDYWKCYRPAKDGYLFLGRSHGHINQNYINNLFSSLIKSLPFYKKGMRFHQLRDTYATLLINNGCQNFTLMKLLGHSSFISTVRYIKCDTSDIMKAPVVSDIWSL